MRSMAGRGRGWGEFAHGSSDDFHHSLDIAEHVIIPEAKHAIAARLEIGSAFGIPRNARVFVVLSAVEFDDKPRRMAGKVCEVRPDSCLAAKMRTANREPAQPLPQHAFGVGWFVTHRTCARNTPIGFA
jgi:hypothetical protein